MTYPVPSTRELHPAAICTDCLMIVANGDDSGIEDPEAHREAMDEGMEGIVRVVPGDWACDACQYPEYGCDGFFSWSPCDLCRVPLAGDRHHAMIELDQS